MTYPPPFFSYLRVVSCQISQFEYSFSADGYFPQDTIFAWYIYKRDEKYPFEKIKYSKSSKIVYTFKTRGLYIVKGFALYKTNKKYVLSELISI